jgi:thiamine-phosphate pyrophosphorylase
MDLGYNVNDGVYLISPPQITNLDKFISDLKFIFKNTSISLFQLRLKEVSDEFIIEAINKIKPVCIKYNVPLILNDNPEIAARFAVDGIHLGKDDKGVNEARRTFQGIIGVSCYNDIERALEIQSEGISYISFGAFYETSTKKDTVHANPEIIKAFKEKKKKVQVCAIGGINSSNAKILIDNGANLIAISSAVWSIAKDTLRVKEIEAIKNLFPKK